MQWHQNRSAPRGELRVPAKDVMVQHSRSVSWFLAKPFSAIIIVHLAPEIQLG
jgi:hypothetical protein